MSSLQASCPLIGPWVSSCPPIGQISYHDDLPPGKRNIHMSSLQASCPLIGPWVNYCPPIGQIFHVHHQDLPPGYRIKLELFTFF